MRFPLFRAFCGLCAAAALAPAASAQRLPNLARSLSAALGAQGRVMWIDGSANLFRTVVRNGVKTQENYTTSRAGVVEIVQKCKAAHLNRLVVDIKPIVGQVLYDSKIAPRLRVWQGKPIPDFDVLAAFVEEGHKAGLRIDACVNILSEGHKFYKAGPAYTHPEWQSVVLTVDRGMISADAARLSVRVPGEPDDPAKPTLLADNSTILGGDPNSRIGLDSGDSKSGVLNGQDAAPYGQQLNIALDAGNHVVGMIDNALLGDDPLIASENGRLMTVARENDRLWCSTHLKPGDKVRFDVRNTRLPITQAANEKVACFINPLQPEARRYELSLLKEILTRYEVDGIVLDRCRFSNIYNDFSDLSRTAFTRWLGKPIYHWPEDVFSFAPIPGDDPRHGPFFKKWLEFRAHVIHDFVADVARTVRTAKPRATLGTYVGAWYPNYFEVGVNWGSENTELRYDWQTDTYPRTGYAEFFDWITTGCYHPIPLWEDARREGLSERGSVEYLADISTQAIAGGAWTYPGLYVPDYESRPENLIRALEACNRQGQGWMLFDLSYVEASNFWPLLERANTENVPSPDALTELLPEIRAALTAADSH